MDKPLWTPDRNRVAQSNLHAFLEWLATEKSLTFSDYAELHHWSVQQKAEFWSNLFRFADIVHSNEWESVLENATAMPGAKWFRGLRLNFAENLLRHRGDKDAIRYCCEDQPIQSISHNDLHQRVARLAHWMKAQGIQPGDRVAAWLPNIPEAVIGMLATASVGAIWSSCSPDFGSAAVLDRFGQIQPKLLICTDGYQYKGKAIDIWERVEALIAALPNLQQVLLVPFQQKELSMSLPHTDLHQILQQQDTPELRFEQLPFDHPLYILYSSGTTGIPKCILHGAGGTLMQHVKELLLHTDLKEQDCIFYYTTCGWMMWNWLVSSLYTGATIFLYDGSPFYPKPSRLFDLIDEADISILGVSAKYIAACEKEGLRPRNSHRLSNLKAILSTGSPLLPESFDYVYRDIKSDVQLSSISGGTDIISCFALGNPMLPVFKGELQCIGLGMDVDVFDDQGKSLCQQKGELVCKSPFPSMPVGFWNDPDGHKYQHAYFETFTGVWAHGDYAELTDQHGLIIYGRSDTLLNPGGVRIGTAEIYRQVDQIDEVLESIAVGQEWDQDIRIVLFVVLQTGIALDDTLVQKIKHRIRQNTTPRHVPTKILQVPEIPRTISGKMVEKAVQNIIHHRPVSNLDALANPTALQYFQDREELQQP